jgi:hypothetical protein
MTTVLSRAKCRFPDQHLEERKLGTGHLDTAVDLFGGPQGSPRTDKMIAAAIQWAAKILQKIDKVFG